MAVAIESREVQGVVMRKLWGNVGDLVDAQKATLEQIALADAQTEIQAARDNARDIQMKLQALQSAVRSIVLRLKVLDVEQMEKEMKEDGTVPLRLALSELKDLLRAYDGMPKENMLEYGWASTVAQPYAGHTAQQMPVPNPYSWMSTSAKYNTGGGQQP